MSGRRPVWAAAAYALLLTLAEPLYFLRLWWRGRAEPLYRHALAERRGRYAEPPSSGWIWVHAVSLGETRAAAALIAALRHSRPGMRLLLTHGTATGREAGAELLRAGDRQVWLPYDKSGAVQRFLRQFRPVAGVLMETEVWPNLLHAAHGAALPMVLANARLSEKSLARGRRVAALLRPAYEALTLTLAQTEADAERLRRTGAAHVVVCGNLKFDVAPEPALLARGRAWRDASSRGVVLAAIFREGEEALLLAAWTRVPPPRPRLVIVPRHPQRFDDVAALVEGAGLTLARRSGWHDAPPADAYDADAWLGDTLGEMPLYYAAAHAALMGGSFAPLGGHNLIEAAASGCPVLLGPHTFNFAEAARLAVDAGAATRVADMAAGVAAALALIGSDAQPAMAERALQFAAAHRGAGERMAARIDALLT